MKSFHANILLFMLFLFLVLFWLQLVTGVNKIDDTATVKLSGAKKKSNKKKKVSDKSSEGDDDIKEHILKIIVENAMKNQSAEQSGTSKKNRERNYNQEINFSNLPIGVGTENMKLSDMLTNALTKAEIKEKKDDDKNIQLSLENYKEMLNPNIT